MKAYTDIEQSKKLAEILPHKTADNTYERVVIAGCNLGIPEEQHYVHRDIPFTFFSGIGIPCWSLAALLEQFEDTAGLAKDYGLWFCYDNRKSYCTKHYDNQVDACVEMILKLHEQKLL